MMQMKRISRRMIHKSACAACAAVLGIALVATPAMGQATTAPATQASTPAKPTWATPTVAIPAPAIPAPAITAPEIPPVATIPPVTPASATPIAAAPSTQPSTGALVAEGLGVDGKVRVSVNKTQVITTSQPYKQVSVGQPDIADVNLIGPNNILVTAKKTGSTQLIVWDDAGRSQMADVVVTVDLDALNGELKSMFPGSKINATAMGGAIALRGQVADLKTAEQAVAVAGPYSPKVMNFIEVAGGQQVMLQVRFAEVSRRATNALGVNFAGTDGTFSFGSNIGQLAPSGFQEGPGTAGALATNLGTGVSIFGSGAIGDVAFRYFIQAMRQNNLLRVLAEPNLIAISGQEASFLAGGEFPVPVPQSGVGGGSTITVEYREFGVRLRFVPIVLGDGRIRLKMSPEVSDLDFSSPLTIQGSNIPIVNKRTVTTTVELADGQTLAIAGLLNNSVAATRDVTPLLGDLPILGTLFRSTRYTRNETELVVLVTPKLVEPMNPNQIPALPGEAWRHPNEAEQYIMGDIGGEVPTSSMKGKTPTAPSTVTKESVPGARSDASSSRYRGASGFTPPPRVTTGSQGQ